jgi:hypothetical protein
MRRPKLSSRFLEGRVEVAIIKAALVDLTLYRRDLRGVKEAYEIEPGGLAWCAALILACPVVAGLLLGTLLSRQPWWDVLPVGMA